MTPGVTAVDQRVTTGTPRRMPGRWGLISRARRYGYSPVETARRTRSYGYGAQPYAQGIDRYPSSKGKSGEFLCLISVLLSDSRNDKS